MSYEPKQWVCGETITADALNNLETGVQEALECCAGGGDAGYSCIEEYQTGFDGTITTTADEGLGQNVGEFVPLTNIQGGLLKVTFNGVEYYCEWDDERRGCGASYDIETDATDWSTYPFTISFKPLRSIYLMSTEEAGTYRVKIETVASSVETSECFEKAVGKIIEQTPSTPKVLLIFEAGEQEPSGYPVENYYGWWSDQDTPSVSDIAANCDTTEYCAMYEGRLMPLTYISSSKAEFSMFEKVSVSQKNYIRHCVITYTSNGDVQWSRYDIEVPTSYAE